jgi:4-methyl-5(b-hydroxyethyl)-thiazole monophosphate biosynthesis
MVYVLLVEGFEEIEAVYPIDVLRRCGINVQTVGVQENITGSNKITVKSDININEIGDNIKTDKSINLNIEMLILPGGPGRINYKKDERILNLLKKCFEFDIPVAAICGTPEILGELGYLKGKQATCYPGLESKLIGAEYVNKEVVIDGNLITSRAAGTSEAFAFAVAEFLCGTKKSKEIYKQMCHPVKIE